MVNQVLLVIVALPGLLVVLETLGLLDYLEQLVIMVHLVRMGQQERLVFQGYEVLQDYLDMLDHLVLKEPQVYLVQQGTKELKGQLVCKATEEVSVLQEPLEIRVALEVLDLLGRKDHQVTVGLKVIKVLLVHKVLLVIRDL